jgi:hypothetical protein
MKKTTIGFAVLYSVVWLASGLIIYSFDYIHGLVTGRQFVDSWSIGMMFWFYLVFIIPGIYILVMAYLIVKKYLTNRNLD